MPTYLDGNEETGNEETYNETEFCTLDRLNESILSYNWLILYVNVRRLNVNVSLLESYIASLSFQPQIVVCSETWVLENPAMFKIENYNIYYNHGNINRADGVVIYIRNDVEHAVNITIYDDFKVLDCKIRLDQNNHFLLTALYRCHDYPKSDFINKVMKKIVENNDKNHLIVGDFNINILNNETEAQDLLNNCYFAGYLPLFNSITRPNENGGTCIDNIFAKSTFDLQPFKHTQVFTDHFSLFCSFNFTETNKKTPKFFCKLNYRKLINASENTDWYLINDISDPDVAINQLIFYIKKCIEKATTKIRKSKNIYRKPWMTSAILKSIEHKEFLYNLWKDNSSLAVLKNEYLSYNKILKKIINVARNNYEVKIVSGYAANPKKLWKYINTKMGKNKSKNCPIGKIKAGSMLLEDSKSIANIFNDFFANIGLDLAGKIQPTQASNGFSIAHSLRNSKSIFLTPISNSEVMNVISNLKDRNGGSDKIHSSVLKAIKSHISPILQVIFNKCISQSVWPSALKTAEIVPIFKSGDSKLVTNYRPISLISNIAKVFEKLIHSRLYNFIIKHKRINPNQYGFLRNTGTTNALNNVTDKILKLIDDGYAVIATFIDLTKAFDTVDHNILLKKLEINGIRGLAHKLLKDYLSNRTQSVRINNDTSQDRSVKIGVPQGTVLGPLLFLIYINDIFSVCDDIFAFADDTVVISYHNNWELCQNNMNQKLNNMSTWFALNKLTINANKSEVITFGCHADSLPNRTEVYISNVLLRRTKNVRYLGVYLDQNLKWDSHIQCIVKKVRYFLYLIHHLKHLPIRVLEVIYYAYVYSLINYGLIVWGGAFASELKRLCYLQEKFIKILKNNNIPTLEELYITKCLVFHYRRLSLTFSTSTSITRNKEIILPKHKKTIFEKNSLYTAIKYFNKLPNHLKVLKVSDKSIRSKITKYFKFNKS